MNRPTSVAMQWNRDWPAPLVVARGKGELAIRLVELARENGIPVVDASELAESLYLVDPGTMIPETFYETVAQIVGFVWRATSDGVDNKKVWDEEHQGH